MNDDAALLRRYAEEGSEAAFTELVRRHIDLVYGAALRRTNGDSHRAADVAQRVFITLARQARKLSGHAVLGAWLHTSTRNAALNLMISEQRRQAREHEALALDAAAGANPDWDRLRPVLDAAIDELPEPDRAAVVLRFLERRAFAEIGALLRVSEDAARMRTERALEKLRALLARRGITSTAAALGAMVSAQPLVSAPAGLAAACGAASLASAGIGAALATFMSTKIITTAVVSALLAFGLGSYVGHGRNSTAVSPTAMDNPAQTQQLAALHQDNQTLKAENERLKADIDQIDAIKAQLAALRAAPPAPSAPTEPLTIGVSRGQLQRSMVNNLRQIHAARERYQLENKHPAGSVHELVGLGSYIKTMRTVAGESYAGLSMDPAVPLSVTTPDGMKVFFDP